MLALVAALAAGRARPQAALPAQKTPTLRGAPSPLAQHRAIKWDVLLAPGWQPPAGLRGVDLGALSDADPRTAALYKQLREAWDQAPVNLALVDQAVRIAGYVVPLEGDAQQGLKEFLLVPSYGACIHTPAPPASQIIHVVPRSPAKGLRTMDTVWVHGLLKYARNDSGMGWSNWRMEPVLLEPYEGGATAGLR